MSRFLSALSFLAVLTLAGCTPPTNSTGGSALKQATQDEKPVALTPAGPGVLAPANAKIEFTGTKKDGKHDGGFRSFSGSISPPDEDFAASKISLEINTDSLYADDPKLTNHLKSPDFFEVKKYPTASFVSTKIEPTDKDGATHLITGDLTLHGTTKPITIPTKVTRTDDALALDSTFTFDRTEYGIAFDPKRVDPTVTVKVKAKVARK